MDTPLTWDDLAADYKKVTGRSAKIRPMDAIFDWAERQPKVYTVLENGSIIRNNHGT